MASLLLTVFLVQLAIHIVNAIGPTTINELLWRIYSNLPTATARHASETNRLRKEVVRLKTELASISAQDEFSKWAKVRRQHDKAVSEHDKSADSVKSTRAKFDTTANTLRWLGTTGLRLLLQFRHSRKPMFWLPAGWVPGYVEWILSFPRAPTGSVSMQVWVLACGAAIAMASQAVVALWALRLRVRGVVGLAGTSGGKIAVPVASTATATEGKKEL